MTEYKIPFTGKELITLKDALNFAEEHLQNTIINHFEDTKLTTYEQRKLKQIKLLINKIEELPF